MTEIPESNPLIIFGKFTIPKCRTPGRPASRGPPPAAIIMMEPQRVSRTLY